MYITEVRVRNDWNDPKRSMKSPTPMVLMIAAEVPAVFEIPAYRCGIGHKYLEQQVKNVFFQKECCESLPCRTPAYLGPISW